MKSNDYNFKGCICTTVKSFQHANLHSIPLLVQPGWGCRKLLSGGRRRRRGGSRAVQAGFTCLTRCHGYPRCVCHSARTRIDRDSDTQTQSLPRTRVAPLRSVSVTKNTLTKNRNLSRTLHRVRYFQNIPEGFCVCRQTGYFSTVRW